MDSNKLKGFFYLGNAVSGKPNYGLTLTFVMNTEYKTRSLRPYILTIRKNSKQQVGGRMSTY